MARVRQCLTRSVVARGNINAIISDRWHVVDARAAHGTSPLIAGPFSDGRVFTSVGGMRRSTEPLQALPGGTPLWDWGDGLLREQGLSCFYLLVSAQQSYSALSGYLVDRP
jgi:hypothetical protein